MILKATDARMQGRLMLYALPVGGFMAWLPVDFYRHNGGDSPDDWFLLAALFGALFTLWLAASGWRFARGAQESSFRQPGRLALFAGGFGLSVFLLGAFKYSGNVEAGMFSLFGLPFAVAALLSGIGHLRLAKGSRAGARAFHRLALVGLALGLVAAFASQIR